MGTVKPRFKMSHISGAILSALCVNTVSLSAIAQENAEKDDGKIEVVEVRAQKRAQSINDVPMAITAANEKVLSEKGVSNVSDMSVIVPAFVASESQTGVPVYTLRGIGFNEESVQATAAVGVYVDDIALPFPIMAGGLMLDVERVEVMKGPQGTLFGQNSTAGAINMLTTTPTDVLEGKFKAAISSYETLDVEGAINLPISDAVRARVALRKVTSGEGWQESVTRDETLGEQDKMAARVTIDADLSDSTLARFTYSTWTDESDSLAPQAVALPFSALNSATDVIAASIPDGVFDAVDHAEAADWTAGTKPKLDKKNDAFSFRVEHQFANDMTLTFLAGQSEFEETSLYNRDGLGGFEVNETTLAVVPYPVPLGGSVLGNSRSNADYRVEGDSYELHLSGGNDFVNWIGGIYLSNSEVKTDDVQWIDLTTNSNSGLKFSSLNNTTSQETQTRAVFASADWQLSDDLTLTTGIRYTQDEADFEGCTRDYDGTIAAAFNSTKYAGMLAIEGVEPYASMGLAGYGIVIPQVTENGCVTTVSFGETLTPNGIAFNGAQAGVVTKSLDENSTSWRTALNYDLTTDTSIYASLSRGFKAGSFPTLSAQVQEQYDPAVQEQLDSLEVGVKAMLADGTAQINASVFYYDYTDKQLRARIPTVFGNLAILDNADSSDVRGIETDFTWRVTDQFTLAGGATYMTTEIGTFEGYSQLGVNADFGGSAFPYSPEFSMNLSANYETELSNGMYLNLGADLSHQGDRLTDYEFNEADVIGDKTLFDARAPFVKYFELDSYTTVNARAAITSAEGYWTASLWVRNLTDEFYSNSQGIGIDTIIRYPARPRTIGVSLDYWF